MASDWRNCTIGQIKADNDRAIAIGPFGSRMKADRYVADGVPVIRGNNISDTRTLVGPLVFVTDETADELRSCNVFPGDLVFPHRGAIGQVGIVPTEQMGRYILSSSLMKLTCNQDLVDPLFIFYFFRSQQGRHALLQNASTVGTPGIGQPLASLRQISVPVPPLPEQRAIAYILGTLDDKIELNRRMNETLEAMARALFKSWFVDFDPVRAKAEGRDPGLPKPLADLFPDTFEDSELGEIPKSWSLTTLGEVAKNVSITFDFKRSPEVVFINTGDVLEGDFLHSNRSSHDGLPGQAKKSIKSDDILFSEIRPANKRFAYVDFDANDYVVSTKFMVIRASKIILPRLLYRILTSDETLKEFQVQAESRSGTFPQITFDSINYLPSVLPPMEIQEAFQRRISDIDARINLNKKQNHTLARLRDMLLPKLISGELRINSQAPEAKSEASE